MRLLNASALPSSGRKQCPVSSNLPLPQAGLPPKWNFPRVWDFQQAVLDQHQASLEFKGDFAEFKNSVLTFSKILFQKSHTLTCSKI